MVLEITAMMADGYLSSLGGDKKFLEYVVMMFIEFYEYTKNHNIYI